MIDRLLCWLFGHAKPDSRVAIKHDYRKGLSTSQCPRCKARLRRRIW